MLQMCLLMDNVLHNEFNYNNIVLCSHSHTRTKARSQKYLYFNTIQYVHCSWLFFIYQKPMMVYKTLCELNKMYCIYIVHVIYYIIYNIVYTVSFSKAGFSQVAVNQVFLFFWPFRVGVHFHIHCLHNSQNFQNTSLCKIFSIR